MIFPTKLSEIQSLIDDEIQESLHLDYKEARAVGKTDKQKIDFAKDVSAFANSDGGVLVYGIKEKGHLPIEITGIEHSKFSREFFEQTIRTNISQPSPNFTVVQIPINEQESIYSIRVEKSYGIPHQCKSNKIFYKRFNFESVAMENYEIEDVRNRQKSITNLINISAFIDSNTTVILEIENIGNGVAKNLEFEVSDEIMQWIDDRKIKPLKDGIRFLKPSEKRAFRYGNARSVFGAASKYPSQFEILVTYENVGLSQVQNETFYIDLDSFYGSKIEKNVIDVHANSIENKIGDLVFQLGNINRNLSELIQIVGGSGLRLSVKSIRNLGQIIKSNDVFNINPTNMSVKEIEELLQIDLDTAYHLSYHFEQGNQAAGLMKLEGITEEIIERIKKHFILDGEIS